MFDTIGAFKKQFTPVEGGYLLYPSAKGGGKLITVEEYDSLVADWQRTAGRGGRWKTVGLVMVLVLLWTLLTEALSLPDWAETLFIAVIVIGISARLLWVSLAPRRLVKNRLPLTLPRPVSDARREARAALNWPLVVFAVLVSGAIFFSTLNASERTPSIWAWLVGSGLMMLAYLWIGLKKLIDRRR